jgi:Beta-propeller repeat
MRGRPFPSNCVLEVIRLSFCASGLLSTLAVAAAPDFLWLKTADGSETEVSYGIAADAAGNTTIAGYFNSTNLTFGGFTVTNSGPDPWYDCFVARLDSLGKVLWFKAGGGTDSDRFRAVAVDTHGNSYVVGYFLSSTCAFQGLYLTNQLAGNSALLVAKLDAVGNPVWLRTADAGAQLGTGIAVDAAGDCYVTGYFLGTNTFGGETLVSLGSRDVFLLKYNAAGDLLWARSGGGSDLDQGSGVAVDGAGNAYLLANIRSTNAVFGSFSFSVAGVRPPAGGSADQDLVVAKYDPGGTILWAQQYGGTGIETGSGIAVDSASRSYITGSFGSTNLVFGADTLRATNEFGFTSSDAFLAQLDSTGNALWGRSAHADFGGASAEGIALDFQGNPCIAGYFASSSLFLGNITLTNVGPGDADVFVARYDASGNVLWAGQNVGSRDQRAFSITVDADANFYVTGWTMGTNVLFGDFAATNAYLDIFVAKLGSDYPRLQIRKVNSLAEISWPERNAGFSLESFTAPGPWSAVASTVAHSNGLNIVTNDLLGPARLFRLRK